YSINDPMVANLNGNSLAILRLGTVMITASQAGNENYHAADAVVRTIQVVAGTTLPEDGNKVELKNVIRPHPALSPNGDGYNDFLIIEGIKDFPENKVTILHQSGKVLWEAKGYNNESVRFTGIPNSGQKLPEGTYFYLLEVKVDKEWQYLKGFFVIKY